MKKVVFYGRYSSHNQTEQSIEGQLHVCEKFAEQNGLEIIAQYIDRAQSGTNANRKEFQRMINDSEKGKFEGVLVYKLDRFARSRFDSAMYKRQLRDNGVKVISATENISEGPEGILMESVLEGMDEYYSAELARKMNRGREESFRKGRYLSKLPPYGYRKENHKLVPDEVTAPIVQEIFQRYANGEKLSAIERWLNEKGITNVAGHKWSRSNLSRMLHKTVYKGEYRFGDFEGFAPCSALITPELFDDVQKKLEESLHKTREGRTGYNYFLTGKIFCADCGRRMCGVSAERKYFYYTCPSREKRLNAGKLHDRILNALSEYLTQEKLDELAAGAYAAYQEEQEIDERPAMEKELADIERQIQNAVNAILKGVEVDELSETISQLKERRASLRSALEDAPTPLPQFTLEQFRFILEKMMEKPPKELLSVFVNQILVKGETAIICINLTNEANTPPMDQILCSVADAQAAKSTESMDFYSRTHCVIYTSEKA